jgi:hypothetical protein
MRAKWRNDPGKPSSQADESLTRTDTRRRGFLLALGVGGAGAAVLAARSLTGVAPPSEPAALVDGSQGYQDTDHVKRYYQTTKI